MSLSSKDYQRVVDVLINSKINHEKITISLAKLHPKIFLKIIDLLSAESNTVESPRVNSQALELLGSVGRTIPINHPSYSNVRNLLNNNLIDAIRTLRSFTGLGLKDAKDVCDAARENLSSATTAIRLPSHMRHELHPHVYSIIQS